MGLLVSFHTAVPVEKVDCLPTWLDNLGFLWGRGGLSGTRSCHCEGFWAHLGEGRGAVA